MQLEYVPSPSLEGDSARGGLSKPCRPRESSPTPAYAPPMKSERYFDQSPRATFPFPAHASSGPHLPVQDHFHYAPGSARSAWQNDRLRSSPRPAPPTQAP